MNIKTVYKLAVVLTRSQIRGTQRSRTLARLFGEPRTILGVDFALLIGLGLIGYGAVLRGPSFLRATITGIEANALAGVPVAIAFAVIVFGVLYEISQPIQSLNTDVINWLPISPAEYVAGSTLSESYIYSFMLSLLLGLSLGPALALGEGPVWAATAVMAIIALATGACVVEALDAVTNRISSSFYTKSGRSGIFFRLALTIVILVFVQLLFSGQIVGYLLRSVVQTVRMAWFVPLVWPSVAVLGAAQGSLPIFLTYASLSAFFVATLFAVAVNLRTRFWTPIPVSIKLSTLMPASRGFAFRLPLVTADELAIVRKDFRSLTRRREMARFLAIPFVLAISMGISLFPFGNSAMPEAGFLSIIFLYIIPVTIFVGILSMTSFGQEGYAVWNLYAAPINTNHLMRAKALFSVFLGVTFSVAMLAVFSLLLKPLATYFWILLGLGIAIVIEQSVVGLCFGARFPDFREMVRARFVGVWGSLLGTLVGLACGFLTALPVLMSVFTYHSIHPEYAVFSFTIAAAVFVVASRLAKGQIQALLENIQT